MIKQAYQVNELNKGYDRQQYKGSTDRKELSLWGQNTPVNPSPFLTEEF